MGAAIEATELAKSYGEVAAVAGVSFSVAQGEIFAYLGRNGSGKTTTVRMLTTLTRPSTGSARVAGFDVLVDQMDVKSRIGVTMQDAALDPQMTGREHLEFIAGIMGHSARSASGRSEEMLHLFGLTDAADRAIGTYSGGMKRRLDITNGASGQAGSAVSGRTNDGTRSAESTGHVGRATCAQGPRRHGVPDHPVPRRSRLSSRSLGDSGPRRDHRPRIPGFVEGGVRAEADLVHRC